VAVNNTSDRKHETRATD